MASQESVWPAILEEIQRNVRSQQFDTWFRNVEMHELSPNAVTLKVPNNFYHQWLKRHYVDTIQRAVLTITGESPCVGSSIKISVGLLIRPRAIANICCSPPLSLPAC